MSRSRALTRALSSGLSKAIARPEGVGFSPLQLFAGGRGGAWYDPSDKSTLFQDVAATTPVTAVGQEVRYIGDKSGNGNHLTITTSILPGIYQEANGHGYVDASVNGCSFKSAATRTLQMPRYIAAAYRKTTSEDNPLFGIIKGASDMHALRGYTALNRAHSWLQGNAIAIAGIPNPISPGERGPLNSLVVEDTLAVVGTVDIGANGLVETTAANNWLVGSAITLAVYGLNMIGTGSGSTSNTNQHFYGGIILEAAVTTAERAATNAYLRSRIERPSAGSDINILVIGDSTGDKVPAGAGDTTGEWVWRFGLDKLAADATAFVGIRTYDETNRVYGPEIVIQQGTGGPTYRIYNCSVAGRTPQYHTGKHFGPGIGNIPTPKVIFWNHGHNVAATGGINTASYQGRFLGPMEQVRRQWPGVPHMLVLQNPWRSTTTMTALVAQVAAVAALYGDIPTADVHQAYLGYVPTKDATLYFGGVDEVHPSMPLGVDQWMAKINAMWDANYPQAPANPAFTATKVANLLANGDFASFGGAVPTSWTLTGNGTLTKDTGTVDTGQSYSAKLVNGVSGSTYLRQTLSAVAYRGQTVTLAVRQYVVTGGDTSAGQIAVGADGAGGATITNFAGLDTQGADGWRWIVVQCPVPADATTITVDLYASTGTGVDKGTAYFGKAVLASGSVPRDML